MDVKPGYKQTEVGVIPEDWDAPELGTIMMSMQLGGNYKNSERQTNWPLIKMGNLGRGNIKLDKLEYIDPSQSPTLRDRLHQDDVLLNTRNTLDLVGKVAIWKCALPEAYYNSNIIRMAFDNRYVSSNDFMNCILNTPLSLSNMRSIAIGTTSVAAIYGRDLVKIRIPLPTKAEQEAIATALSDADALIESLEQLIAKKRNIKQGAMQELLTGKKRLPGFSGEWKVKQIAEIASPKCEKNSLGEQLTVLTCSKHLGFVDSLDYFKNQVFSRDTSGYKIIKRGEIGYPANHVEEGSIGLQSFYDRALVSPIYVVFSVNEEVDSYFLHRLLKLECYRQKFETATCSSVDRRGSLRWPAFSEITVSLPPLVEQTAISAILGDMDTELSTLESQLSKARQIKQGMMQELLTGRVRLI